MCIKREQLLKVEQPIDKRRDNNGVTSAGDVGILVAKGKT
jgi:hypothetical protein